MKKLVQYDENQLENLLLLLQGQDNYVESEKNTSYFQKAVNYLNPFGYWSKNSKEIIFIPDNTQILIFDLFEVFIIYIIF